jgi:hypothetical protein
VSSTISSKSESQEYNKNQFYNWCRSRHIWWRLPQKTDTSTHTQLLFIWGYRCNIFYPLLVYSQVWLIEHEDTLVWDKDKLRMLYDKYYELWYTDDDSGPYLLNDNTKMNVEEGFFYGGYEMHAFVSEEKRYLSYRKPLWVDPNR